MIKIVVVVLSEISAGELTIAYEFSSRLTKHKYDVVFLIPEKHSSYLRDRNEKYFVLEMEKGPLVNKAVVDRFVEEFRPDFFILSDSFTTEFSRTWSGLSFESLQLYNVPIIGVDEYEYLTAGFTLDYYGGSFKKLPPLVEKCDYIIRNCPLNALREDLDENVKLFSLYNKSITLSQDIKGEVREKLNIEENEKLIFFASSAWEMMNYHRIPALGMFIKWVPLILQNYLASLGEKVTLLHVGPKMCPEVESTSFRYINFDNIVPTEFDRYLLSSDLFITLNIVSVTLSKAIFGGIPSLVFQNLKYIDFTKLDKKLEQMPSWYRQMAEEVRVVYPFRASTFGWYEVLKSVLKDNEYLETFVEVPFLKMSEALNSIRKYLFDEEAINNLKILQSKYVKKIIALPSSDEIMSEIMLQDKIKKGG